jgi:hypothetical protein
MEPLFTRLAARLAPHGLNLLGATPAADYDTRVPDRWAIGPAAPEVRTLIVIGNGGGAFWEAYQGRIARDPAAAEAPDPLDAFTRSVVEDAVAPLRAELGGSVSIVYPFDVVPPVLSFMHLAECAGLGSPSLLGILVHPVYGPWMALRAALLLPYACADMPRPADGFDPCPTCIERPCIAACPGGAIGPGGWDIPRCGAHRLSGTGDGCDAGCHARIACVLGPEHRYPPEALAFHQSRSLGAVTRSPNEAPGGAGR